ncbi:DUF4124 domain-containing protein [Litoribrevibacter albus]|uniref:DUF4124 domain-containing protein n=1 Tax=Litoribrevibacter albus TaxID=1473156 RepID=A0AA37SFY4_9GAMM|nr:DUF4124 domain-containing protein [Litoribrevibacter albus]GLQ33499.1 hypothetical protein GCM10007876_39790 [Litoribrevibacter albus]
MKNSVIFTSVLALALTCTNTVHAKVYKWVTEDGTVVYSDQPHPEAEVLNIEPLHPYKAPSYNQPQETTIESEKAQVNATSRYSSVTIDSPEHEANIQGSAGSFTVAVSSNPALKKGDKYQLLIDGKALGAPTNLTQFNVQNINRGEHSIAVQILDKQGENVITSPSITVFIHRPTVKRKTPK